MEAIVLVGIIGIFLGLSTLIYFCWKQVPLLVAAPVAALIVIIFNGMDVIPSIFGPEEGSYMVGLGGYIIDWFMLFMLGAIFAKFMEDSGAASSIAHYILKKFGTDNPYRVMVAILLVGMILTYGGISLFVVIFAILPLARVLFKQLDIAWPLVNIPLWAGIILMTMTMIPGTPASQNVIPTSAMGVSLTALAVPSLIAAAACTMFVLWYMKYALKKSLEKGENYSTYVSEADDAVGPAPDKELPDFIKSILPLATLVTIAIVGSQSSNPVVTSNIIYVALLVAIFLALILFWKYIPDKKATLNTGAISAVIPIFNTAATVGFGAVVMAAPGFDPIQELIFNLPGGVLVTVSVLCGAMAAITGSASGALSLVFGNPEYVQYFMDSGVNPELIARTAAISANLTTAVPHCGVIVTFFTLAKLNHKNSYKYAFIPVFFGSAIAWVIVVVLGSLMY